MCPLCADNPAVIDDYYGLLPCLDCQNKEHEKPQRQEEHTTDDIREQRKAYLKDILPPHRKGYLSKEWLNIHGAEKARAKGFSDTEIREARNVWDSETYYKQE